MLRFAFLAMLCQFLSGCDLLQRANTREAAGSPPVMMLADTVPLMSEGDAHIAGTPMPVPEEPSPFEQSGTKKLRAMQSDLESHKPAGDELQRIPAEPIPSARLDQ